MEFDRAALSCCNNLGDWHCGDFADSRSARMLRPSGPETGLSGPVFLLISAPETSWVCLENSQSRGVGTPALTGAEIQENNGNWRIDAQPSGLRPTFRQLIRGVV
jgi:hypothetical protein